MNRAAAAVALSLILTAGAATAETLRGSWTASSEEAGKVQLNITRRNSNNGHTYLLRDFSGLTDTHMRAAVSTPVQFALQREAGTLAFDGTFKDGYGGGQFTFTPNGAYLSTIQSMGLNPEDVTSKRETIDEALLQLAVLDVSTAYIRSMQAEGYRVALDKYIAMRIFKVTPELIREFRQLGYDKLDADDLVGSQVHRVTPAYIREMQAAGGRGMSMDDLVASRIHRATPEFAAEMRSLGYTNLDHDDLVAFRIHGVSGDFVRELRELGYMNIKSDDLVAMRIHRVTPAFIRQLKDAGYEKIPVEKLVSMRIHGVDADFVKKMNKK
jgi:hypothetical protein